MPQALPVLTFLLTSTLVSPSAARAQVGEQSAVADSIRRVLQHGDLPGASQADFSEWRKTLQQLYTATEHRPVWTVDGAATVQAESVLMVLAASDAIGLMVDEYDAVELRSHAATLTDAVESTGDVARFDVWLSLSLMRYMQHTHRGRVDPRTLRFALPAERKRLDLDERTLAISRAEDVRARLAALEPQYSQYTQLKAALARYRTLAADSSLPSLPAAPKGVRPGEPWVGSRALRRWLVALGDLPADAGAPASATVHDLYDSTLAEGVKRFQSRHGLEVDGVLGRATVQALRQPLSSRVQQIELALERWRWMPDDTSARYVVVNIPEFRVRVYNRDGTGDHSILALDIIVGEARKRRFTPVFNAVMNEVIFRPYWDVPVRIARNEETPKIRRRPGYFKSEEMEIVTGYEENVVRYPPTPANLAKVDAGTLRLRQRPGDKNALGLVKFIFPNEYDTYLHGTPAQSLFTYARRDFSHGCMRVRDPERLAEVVLEREGGWGREQIESAMHGERTMHVLLEHPIPVYVLYLTAMPDSAGDMRFSPDIYRHDVALASALRKRVPEIAGVRVPTEGSSAVTECREAAMAPSFN